MDFVTIVFFVCLLLTVGVSFGFLWAAARVSSHEEKETASSTAQIGGSDAGDRGEHTKTVQKKGDSAQKDSTDAVENKIRRPWSKTELVLSAAAGLLVLIGLGDLFGIADFGAYHGAPLLMGITALLEFGVYQIVWHHKSKTIRFFGKLLLIATILEVTLFQFPSYHLLFGGDYPMKTLMASEAQVESGNCELDETTQTLKISGKDEAVLTFSNLQQPVGTLQVQAKLGANTNQTAIVLDASDETHETYRYDIAKSTLIKDCKNSQYISCQLSGDVTNLRVKFTGSADGDVVQLQSIQLNVQIPFQVSPLRMGLIVLLGTMVYAIICASLLRKPYCGTKRFCRRTATIMTACVMLLAVLIVGKELPNGGVKQQLQLSYGNQITQELVDAFENKQISLLKEPSQELIDMENPYDWSARNDAGVSAEWDHVYYEGKYYSYYGIAPVVLLFLPYHLITGHYFSTNLAVLLFGLIGLLFLAMTYMAVVKRWFQKVPAGCVLAGLAILFSACGIWYSLGRTLFYEISISSGFAFVTMGAYCLLSSNILGKGKVSLPRTALASVFLGIAVLCRPTLAVYAICACLYFLFGIPKAGHVLEEGVVNGVNRVRRLGYVLCAVLPLLTLGIVQMWYNTARFGSPFDFGIQYSLTINDFTNSQYATHFVLIGLYNYLFAVPAFSPEYPFITTPFSKLEVNGYYFSDVGNTSGILFLALPVVAYFLYSRSALRRLPNRGTRLKYAALIGLPCVVMPIVIICSIWESGYAIRYTADFSWQIIMGAFAILFFLYQKSRNETKKAFLRTFMAVSTVCAIVINGVQIFNFAFEENNYPALCNHLEQLVAFWK